MAMSAGQFLDPRPQPRRGRWRWYKTVPIDGCDLWCRATTFADTIDDNFKLSQWNMRMVARGIVMRQSLAAQVALIPAEKACSKQQKEELNQICANAKEVAGGSDRADLGTLLHTMTEQHDRGVPIDLPEPYASDIRAYDHTLKENNIQILPNFIEQVVIVKQLQVAGTFDRVVEHNGEQYIFDLKTGDKLDFSESKFTIQMTLYSMADHIYEYGWAEDGSEDKIHPMPKVNQEKAIICHLPAGQATCTLHWAPLTQGREAIEHVRWVRHDWRRRRHMLTPFAPAKPALALQQDRRAWLVEQVERIKTLGGLDTLAACWPAGVPTFRQSDTHTADQLEAVARAVVDTDKKLQAPFPDTEDPGPEPDDLVSLASLVAGDDRGLQAILIKACQSDRQRIEAVVDAMACFAVHWEQTNGHWHLKVDLDIAGPLLHGDNPLKPPVTRALADQARRHGHPVPTTYQKAVTDPVLVALQLAHAKQGAQA
jgi:hypothetical protein